MSHSSRILIVGGETGPADDISGTLAKRGVESRFAASAEAMRESLKDTRPDIVIVDGRGGSAEISGLLDTILNNGDTPHVPVIFISGKTGLAPDALAHVDNVLPNDFREVELLSRLDSLSRLNTMQDELIRRGETDRLYGLDDNAEADTALDMSALKVIVAGTDTAVIESIGKHLDETTLVTICDTGHEVLSALTADHYDCVMIDGADAGFDAARLCEGIRSNPRLYHLPVLVIAAGDSVDAYYGHGASDVIAGDWQDADIRNRVLIHARHQRTRSKMLEVYGKAIHLVTSDSLTGLYSHGYLHAHLANQIKDSESKGHDLSVGFFRLSELRDVNETFGYAAGDKVLRQIGTILSCIVRGEDLPARYAGNEFCIVFPDTPADTARRIVQRIKSVIESTELAVPGMDRSVSVLVDAASETLSHGRDTARDLIARARKAAKS